MDKNNAQNTPKPKKHLGLRRSPRATPKIRVRSDLWTCADSLEHTSFLENSKTTPCRKRHLDSSSIILDQTEQQTPAAAKNKYIRTQRSATTTNCRSQQLPLSQRLYNDLPKKRLEFQTSNNSEQQQHETTTILVDNGKAIQIFDIEQSTTPSSKNNQDDLQTPDGLKNCNSRKALSTGYRPHILSLTKRMRPKKRLDFHAKNEQESCVKCPETIEPLLETGSITTVEDTSSVQSSEFINNCSEEAKKIMELEAAIKIWQNGFSAAMEELQENINPRMEKNELLAQLRISQDMLQYLED